MNHSTVEVTWEPPSNDSHVDFYQYQLMGNLTEVIVSTTNTTAVLSGIPYNACQHVICHLCSQLCWGKSTNNYNVILSLMLVSFGIILMVNIIVIVLMHDALRIRIAKP